MGCRNSKLSKKQHEEIQKVYGIKPISNTQTMMSQMIQMQQLIAMINANNQAQEHSIKVTPTHMSQAISSGQMIRSQSTVDMPDDQASGDSGEPHFYQ